ncbi:MAG: YigZ family protein [Prevotellaceae bacterium]|jgi:uncharacterized YigZ family protein|nr:YigZ family protein [Prevotellaceae bacterium]
MKDTYKAITTPATGVFKDKGSKFLAFAFPVENETEIKQHIQQLKKEYFDARHHCYAYRLGLNGELWRANDDGEPSSTGGKPILGQLLSLELTNVLVVVVRYFGGIQLGVSGLINAYRSATADALVQAQIVEKVAKEILTVNFSYLDMNQIMKLVKEEELEIISQHFDNECKIKLAIPLSKKDKIVSELSSLIARIYTNC